MGEKGGIVFAIFSVWYWFQICTIAFIVIIISGDVYVTHQQTIRISECTLCTTNEQHDIGYLAQMWCSTNRVLAHNIYSPSTWIDLISLTYPKITSAAWNLSFVTSVISATGGSLLKWILPI